jgi:flavin reductase (DIM6/NTAB) family NADH-FMN oxidoreductase RutF
MRPDDFKAAFAHLPTAVCVVTAGPATDPAGVTVGTLSPLSLAPPLLMFALKQESRLLHRLRPETVIGLNILGEGLAEIATRFSRSGDDRFEGPDWDIEQGPPRLKGVALWMEASVQDRTRFGDHVLVSALLTSAEVGFGRPLLHWRRAFTQLAPDAEGVA